MKKLFLIGLFLSLPFYVFSKNIFTPFIKKNNFDPNLIIMKDGSKFTIKDEPITIKDGFNFHLIRNFDSKRSEKIELYNSLKDYFEFKKIILELKHKKGLPISQEEINNFQRLKVFLKKLKRQLSL